MANELSKGRKGLSTDLRPIDSVWFLSGHGGGHQVGQLGVTAIEAYDEHGDMSMVPWLAVIKGDEIAQRIPAPWVSVHYRTKAEEGF